MKDFENLTEEQQNEVIMSIGSKLTEQEIWYWEGLVHSYRELKERNNRAIEYIESNPLVYYGDYDIRVNDIQQQESGCEELKFIETLTKILRGDKE